MAHFKILLLGEAGSGKTEFIKRMSELPVVYSAKRIPGLSESVRVEYGRVWIGDDLVTVLGICGKQTVAVPLPDFASSFDALLFVVDATRPDALLKTLADVQNISTPHKRAFLIIASKVDLLPDSVSVEELQNSIYRDDPSRVIPCVVVDSESTLQVITRI